MNDPTFKPEPELEKVWFIVLAIIYCVIMLPAFIPWAAEALFGARINGSLPTAIIAGSITVVMVPFLFWIPAYYRSLAYRFEEDAIRGVRGVFWKRTVTVPYSKITNVDITQGPLQRAYGIGNLQIQTAGASASQGGSAELTIYGVTDLEGLKDRVMGRIAGERPLLKAGEAAGGSEREILRSILEELRAIREQGSSRN